MVGFPEVFSYLKEKHLQFNKMYIFRSCINLISLYTYHLQYRRFVLRHDA